MRVQIDLNRDFPLQRDCVRAQIARWQRTGAFAPFFVHQMIAHAAGFPYLYGGRPCLFEIQMIFETLAVLEGHDKVDRTKPAERFRGSVLCGLWKKHFFQASSLVENLLAEHRRDGMGLIIRKMKQYYGMIPEGKPIDERDIGMMVDATVTDAITQRFGRHRDGSKSRLTGEWIVFAKVPTGNIYLCAASHTQKDEEILAQVTPSVKDFPELEQIVR